MVAKENRIILIVLPKVSWGLLLLCMIPSLFMADKAYSNEPNEFIPEVGKVKKYIGISFHEVQKELEEMKPQERINYSLLLASRQFFQFKNAKLAKKYCDYALSIADKHNLKKGEILYFLAHLSNAEKDLPRTIEYINKALVCFKKEQNFQLLTDGLSFLGSVAYRYGDFNKSINAYRDLLELSRESENKLLEAQTIFDLGEVYYRIGNQSMVEETISKAIEIFTKNEDEKGLADCFKLLGNVYKAEKDYAKAKEHYTVASQHYKNTNDSHGQGNCNFNLGLVCKELKEYPRAIDSFNKAIFYYTNSGSTEGVGIAQMESGRVYYLQGNYPQAESALKQAEYLLSKSNAKFRLAQTEDFLGDLKLFQKDKNQAISYYNSSIQNYESLKLNGDVQRVMKKLKDLKVRAKNN